MPIVFAAITPHPPVLIPEIGKDNLKKIQKTQAAMKQLEQVLYTAKPDSILLISPHGHILEDSFNINLSPDYVGTFKDFGDFGTELKFKSDYMTIQEIRSGDEGQRTIAPFVLTSERDIDHGFTVPLYFLTQHLKNIPIIPVTYSDLDYDSHVKFGEFLHARLSRLNKRYAVIASGDLAHTLTKDAPAGFNENSITFDKKVVELVKNNQLENLAKIDPALIKDAKECGLRAMLVLAGLIKSINTSPEVLSYEGPFGVGYLVANFKFQ